MDVINLISKVPGLPDAPISNPRETYQPAPMYYANGSVLSVLFYFSSFSIYSFIFYLFFSLNNDGNTEETSSLSPTPG